jgi:integrase/recombinase XerD
VLIGWLPTPSPATFTTDDPMLRLAVAAHLARYKGESRIHTASDLNSYLRWCFERDVSPLHARRGHVELYLRWLQDVRRLRPPNVSRRLSVLATFYRPASSTASSNTRLPSTSDGHKCRDAAKLNDFALVAMLGLLGLRIFGATGADIAALGEARGHWVLKIVGEGDKTALIAGVSTARTHPRDPRRAGAGRSTPASSMVRRTDPAQPRGSIALSTGGSASAT